MILERFLNNEDRYECAHDHTHGGGNRVAVAPRAGEATSTQLLTQSSPSSPVIETTAMLTTDTRGVIQSTVATSVSLVTTATVATPAVSSSLSVVEPVTPADPQTAEIIRGNVVRIATLVSQIKNSAIAASAHDRAQVPGKQAELKTAIIVLLGARSTWNDNLLKRAEAILREYGFTKEASQLFGAINKRVKK